MPVPRPCQGIATSIAVAQADLAELLHPEPWMKKPTPDQITEARNDIADLKRQLAECISVHSKSQGYGIVLEISQRDVTRTICDLLDPGGAGVVHKTETIRLQDGALDPATGKPTDGTRLRAEVGLELKRAWFMNREVVARPQWPDPGWRNLDLTDPGWVNLDLICSGRIVLEEFCLVTTDSNGVQKNHFYPAPDPPPDMPLELGLTVSTRLVVGDIQVIDHPCSRNCGQIAAHIVALKMLRADLLAELQQALDNEVKRILQRQINELDDEIAQGEKDLAECQRTNPGAASMPPGSKYRYQDLCVNFADNLKISCDWGPVGPCEVVGNDPLPSGKCNILRSTLFGLAVLAEMFDKKVGATAAARSKAAELLPLLEEKLTSSIKDYLNGMGDAKNGRVLFQRFPVDGPESDSAIQKREYHVYTPNNTASMLICIKTQLSTGAENPAIEQYDSAISPYVDAAVVIDEALLLGSVIRDRLASALQTDSFALGDDDVLRLTRTKLIKGGDLSYDLTKLEAWIVPARVENGVFHDGEIRFSGSIHKSTWMYTISSDFGFSLSFSPTFILDESKVSGDLCCCSSKSVAVGIDPHLSDPTTSNSSLDITAAGYIALGLGTLFLFGIPAMLFFAGATAVADWLIDIWGEGGVVGTAVRNELRKSLSGIVPQSSLGLSGYHFDVFELRDSGLAVTLRKLPRELRVNCYLPDDLDADRRIQALGGLLPGTSIAWRLSLDEAIASVRRMDEIQAAMSAGTVPPPGGAVPRTFYIEAPSGEKTPLVAKMIQKGSAEVWYLTTKGDDMVNNGLLALPHCDLAVDPVEWWPS